MAFWKRKTRANPFLHTYEIAEMLRSAGNKGTISSTFSVVSGYMILLIRTAQRIDTRRGCFFQDHTVAGNTNYRAKDMITIIVSHVLISLNQPKIGASWHACICGMCKRVCVDVICHGRMIRNSAQTTILSGSLSNLL